MINKIENNEQLQAEKERMTELLEEKKNQISNDFDDIKENLKPVRQVTHAVSNMLSNQNKNNLVRLGVTLGVELILNKIILRRAGWATKLIVPFLVRNVALNYINDHREEVITKALHLVKRISKSKNSKNYINNKSSKIINYPTYQGQSVEDSLKTVY